MDDTPTPETDALYANSMMTPAARKLAVQTLERERDKARRLNEWNVQQAQILHEGIHKARIEFSALRDAAVKSIRELNNRLIERQESFQAQLIRIENTWREKLAVQKAEVVDLALCETERLVLRQGQLYRFTALPDCTRCQELAGAYHKTPSKRPS